MTANKITPKKTILFIGGGSGGHIMPLIPLMRELKNHSLHLISSDQDIDRTINTKYIPDFVLCHYIRTGKLRRYFDLENILDIVRTLKAIWIAHRYIKNIQPDVLFLKGGYVGVPFALANKIFQHNIPLFTHESDRTPGLATRIANTFAQESFGNFLHPATPLFFVPEGKPTNPYTTNKPKVLVLSGSLGGVAVNKIIEQNAAELLKTYHLTVLSGKGKALNITHSDFEQHEFLPPAELANYLHHCDIVLSRGGANSMLEIMNAKKPSIIIPLPAASSRGDQYLNAQHFAEKDLCTILEQDDEHVRHIKPLIEALLKNKKILAALEKTDIKLRAKELSEKLLTVAKNKK